jgi:hypothetical protein
VDTRITTTVRSTLRFLYQMLRRLSRRSRSDH